MIKEFKKEKVFFCYSINLHHFLKMNNLSYLDKGINPKTNKIYWIYDRNQRFISALTTFSEGKMK